LIGDGRDVASEDKINETNIRTIYSDDVMYSHRIEVAAVGDTEDIIEAIIRGREFYKGLGSPTLFTTTSFLTDMLLVKDTTNRRIYNTQADLEATLRVSKIVEVPVMTGVSRDVTLPSAATLNLIAILVNPRDYVIGADKGGAVSMFDDFDIDYNQFKYLMETRISGALIQPKSAIVIEQVSAG
jgi:HK97 family phage major capsid protein